MIFYTRKNTKNLEETRSPARVLILMKRRPAIDRQRNGRKGALTSSRLGATDTSDSDNRNGDGDGDVYVCVCVCARARACVRECVRACVRDVFAIYDNNI